MACIEKLRALGITIQMNASGPEGMPSMKSQFKRADSSSARFALVFGPDELANGAVTVKALRDASVEQRLHSLSDLSVLAESLQSLA
jgi:histidyl-tRNA synthetase